MLKSACFVVCFMMLVQFSACTEKNEKYVLEVSNTLDVIRSDQVVEVPKSKFEGMLCEEFSRLSVNDPSTGTLIPSQIIDTNMDGTLDILIFMVTLKAGETKKCDLVSLPEPPVFKDLERQTFCRFVPERIDDYAWENDRVAFRTYGPLAQKMVEEGTKGGALSSGFDCWLKRVDYPIIDKWYKKTLEGKGSYHKDTGEGLDDFQVGASRGCGGIGIWDKDELKLYTSRNFSEWKTIAVGPLRTEFELKYQPWDGPDGKIHEKKIISLDLGSNLMKVEVFVDSEKPVEAITAGITLGENKGKIQADEESGWFSYWGPHGDSELGMGIVAEPRYIIGYTEHLSENPEESHLLVHLKPFNGRVVYYTGFGWKKAGLFTTEQQWNTYLDSYCKSINHPITVTVRY